MERYKHPIARDIEEKARRVGGHGGMDFIMDYRLVYCLQHGLPLDQDVFDAAEWSCNRGRWPRRRSRHNSMPVAMPTSRGDWDRWTGSVMPGTVKPLMTYRKAGHFVRLFRNNAPLPSVS